MRLPKGGIAFFDSGIGGLTVLAECARLLPRERFYYFGDNRRAPYGNRSPKTIRRYVFRVFRRFQKLRVKAAVVACNTATAVCIDRLREKFPFPVIGAEPAVFLGGKRGGECLILSTKATYESERFQNLLRAARSRYQNATFTACACPRLAGEIERRIMEKGADFTPFLPRAKPNVVVLGCTHYVYVKAQIEGFYGAEAVDGNAGIARRLQACLLQEERGENALSRKKAAKSSSEKELLGQTLEVFPAEQGEIYFLGKSKMVNETIYEQMFVSKVGKKGQ